MTVNKRKKNTRERGDTSHGWGAKKKHRGSGNRGGAGMAGTGKRADQKKPSIWKNGKYFGKFGFTSKSRMPDITPINIKTIEDMIETLAKTGAAKIQNGAYYVNLDDLGYNKLLGAGNATKKLMITVPYAAEGAVQKVQEAGGNVTITGKKKEKKSAEAAKDK
jgi:large subunit ribosomal protein L15